MPPIGPGRCCGSSFFTDDKGSVVPSAKRAITIDTRTSDATTPDVVTLRGNWPIADALTIDDGSSPAEDTVRVEGYQPAQGRDWSMHEDLTIRAGRLETQTGTGFYEIEATALALDVGTIETAGDEWLDTYVQKVEARTVDDDVYIRNGTGLQIGGVTDATSGIQVPGWQFVSIEARGWASPLSVVEGEKVTGGEVRLRSGQLDLAGEIWVSGGGAALQSSAPDWPGPRAVDLGATGNPDGAYAVSQAELDRVHGAFVEIGSPDSGLVTVSAPINIRDGVDLISGGGLTATGGGSLNGIGIRFTDASSTGRTWTINPTSVKVGDGNPIPYSGRPSPLWIRGGSGADTFEVKASPDTAYYMQAGDPATAPGDTLVYDAEARAVRGDLDPPKGDVSSDGVWFVGYEAIETLSIVNGG